MRFINVLLTYLLTRFRLRVTVAVRVSASAWFRHTRLSPRKSSSTF